MKDYSGAIATLEDGVKKHPKHFLVEKMRYDLARNYWLRAQRKQAEGESGEEDLDRALDQVSRVISEVADTDLSPMSWRYDARYLRSILQKPGDALKVFPDGKPPARARLEKEPEKKADETGEKKAGEKKADEKKADEKKADEKKSDTKKPEVPKAPEKPKKK
jgi:hypothetical protein